MGSHEKLRIGILGSGRMARSFATGLRATDKATLVAVGSRKMDTAKRFADDFGGAPHATYEALADDHNVDLVYIATPHTMHS